MGNKLYLGGLPYSVTEGQLEEIFSKHGSVLSAHVISDKFSGKSRGFGFVEMASSEVGYSFASRQEPDGLDSFSVRSAMLKC